MAAKAALVSVVIPMLNEAECLPKLFEELRRHCDGLAYRFEFLFVDDGSTDATPAVLAGLHQRDARVRYLRLSRNFGHQAALSAGLAHAAGDAVVMMDGDLQHPPALIPALLEKFEAGYEVVNTVRRETAEAGPLKRFCSRLFYRVFNWAASVRIEPGGADFRLLARPAVDALNELPEVHRFLRGLVPWLGFRQTAVEFDAPRRFAGRPKYTFGKSLRFALEGITAFSYYPLRRAAVFGWVMAVAGFGYGLAAVAAYFLTRATVPGWTSLLACMVFLGGCQLLVTGVLGEYLGRVLEQVKGRPLYIIREAVGLAVVPARRLGGAAVSADDQPARRSA